MTDENRPLVFLGMPHYGSVDARAARSFWAMATTDEVDVIRTDIGGSLLARGFNTLWATALNWRSKGVTHFGMLHADIVADDYWVDTLLAELVAHEADVVSVVVPIKSREGVTSTAIDSKDDPWEVERRLTMAEVMQLPETFSAADCGYAGRALCVNSGCWIADLRKPWVETVHFEIRDRLRKNADGQFVTQTMSEDWLFSRQLHALGAKVMATRKVSVKHVGAAEFSNTSRWGTYEVDHMANGRPLPIFGNARPSLRVSSPEGAGCTDPAPAPSL